MDLSTRYLGFELPHPFIAGAGPMGDSDDGIRALEEGGAAAIVLRSLFQEQIDREALATFHSTEGHAESYGEATSYFADPEEFVIGPHEYLERIRRAKEIAAIPVFGSLNGHTRGGWVEYGRLIEEAGADALELNLYDIVTDPAESSADVEGRHVSIVRAVARELTIPVAVKISPFYASPAHFAHQLELAGAAGVVVFNRFFEADIDVEALQMRSQLHLSDSREVLLRLRWLAVLSATLERADLAVTGGVHTGADAVKAVMCGASAVQIVAAILHNGPHVINHLKAEVGRWLLDNDYHSLQQMRGSMNLRHTPDSTAITRGNYMHQLLTYDWS
jgi:dihydroorotate dehydrogenase (fumarate)